jgi:hypothetical protein
VRALQNNALGELGRGHFATCGTGWGMHFHPSKIRNRDVTLWLEKSSPVPISTFRNEIPLFSKPKPKVATWFQLYYVAES